MDQLEHLAKTVNLLREGRLDEARRLAQERVGPAEALLDPAFHLRWAQVYDELELEDPLLVELDRVRRLRPDDPAMLIRLSELYSDAGKQDRSRELIQEALTRSPAVPELYRELAKRTEDPAVAQAVLTKGYELTRDESLRREAVKVAAPMPIDDEAAVEYPHDSHLVRFLDLFPGREGVHARQWSSPTGASGYNPVREHLSVSIARNHVLGNYTIGVYHLSLANQIKWLAFDVDLRKDVLNQALNSAANLERALRSCLRTACKLVDALARLGLETVLEFSGYKGYHVWVLLEAWIPASLGRDLVQKVAAVVQPEPGCSLDLFPQQSQVRSDGLGNLIKLPLGVHKKSGRRAVFVDPQGTELPRQLALLAGLPQNPIDALAPALRALAQAHVYQQGRPPEEAQPPSQTRTTSEKVEALPPEGEVPPQEPSANEPPFETEPRPQTSPVYDLYADDAVLTVLAGCEQLRGLVARAMEGEVLDHDEYTVLRHSLAYLPQGKEAVNYLVRRCRNHDPSLLISSPLRATPISCRRIRERLKRDCACRFEVRTQAYENPLLHLDQGRQVPRVAEGVPLDIGTRTFETVVRDFLETRKTLAELKKRLEEMERYFDRVFQSGALQIETTFGTLVRVEHDGKVGYRLELE